MGLKNRTRNHPKYPNHRERENAGPKKEKKKKKKQQESPYTSRPDFIKPGRNNLFLHHSVFDAGPFFATPNPVPGHRAQDGWLQVFFAVGHVFQRLGLAWVKQGPVAGLPVVGRIEEERSQRDS